MMISTPKPLQVATRRVLTCAGCGRYIDRRERINLCFQPACPDCGSLRHCWERIPAGWLTQIVYRFRLWRWKRAQLGIKLCAK